MRSTDESVNLSSQMRNLDVVKLHEDGAKLQKTERLLMFCHGPNGGGLGCLY